MRLLVYVVTVLLAGCVDVPGEPGENLLPDPVGPEALDWELSSCLQVGANMLVPADRVQGRLPSGFTVGPGPAGLAVLGIEALQCPDATIGNVTAPLGLASVWAPVVPPEDLAVEGARHYLRWEVLLSDEAWPTELWDLEGVQRGTVGLQGQAAASQHEAILGFAEFGATTIEGIATRDFAGFGYGYVDFVEDRSGGFATIQANLTAQWFAQGNGVVVLPSGSWVAQMVGSDRVPATTWTSEVSIVGNLTVPSLQPSI